ncbi:TfuA-like protein [uncultured Streptomyces sp.]|uniref:TfuA-like protein n=1 Tax=uncultured Streptomyces sp. TaxID=174707 RepID=UPI00261115BD|nr:TfuA-like protein [uncultured Streptomyces sp.]
MTSRRFAFVGPTLPPSERPDHGYTYLPPVRHGDLYALDARPGDRILIVDGVYQHFAPIRHKEILAQLARGVHVAGAASLGALRAAELDGFGMRGIGHVYGQARDGRLVADSDVALLHADDGEDEGAARGLTLPLVAVRHAAGRLLAAGKLDAQAAAEAERAAAALHFTERSARALLHRAGDARGAVEAVLAEIAEHGDVKKQDALLALAAEDAPAAVSVPAASVWHSSYGREGEFDHRPLLPGSRVTARIALACLQLFAADFPDRHRAYALRLAATAAGPAPDADAGRVLAAAGFPPAPRPEALLARSTAATVGWTADERLLARTFRLPPGRLVYHDLPPEALAGASPAEVERWCLRLLPPAGRPPAPTGRCHLVLRDLWQARSDHEYRLCVLERGFRDEQEAARLARVFDLELVDRLARTAA